MRAKLFRLYAKIRWIVSGQHKAAQKALRFEQDKYARQTQEVLASRVDVNKVKTVVVEVVKGDPQPDNEQEYEQWKNQQ